MAFRKIPPNLPVGSNSARNGGYRLSVVGLLVISVVAPLFILATRTTSFLSPGIALFLDTALGRVLVGCPYCEPWRASPVQALCVGPLVLFGLRRLIEQVGEGQVSRSLHVWDREREGLRLVFGIGDKWTEELGVESRNLHGLCVSLAE